MEEEYSATEKQQMIEKYEKSQKRLYTKGKIIVFVIATFNIVTAIASAFTNLNLITLIVQIALSVALFRGVSWVRYFFAVSAGITCLLNLLLLSSIDFSTAYSTTGKYLLISYIIFLLLYNLVSGILLFTSKSVSEFLYSQKNG